MATDSAPKQQSGMNFRGPGPGGMLSGAKKRAKNPLAVAKRLAALISRACRGLWLVVPVAILAALPAVLIPPAVGDAVAMAASGLGELKTALIVLAFLYVSDAALRMLQMLVPAFFGQGISHAVRAEVFDAAIRARDRTGAFGKSGDAMSRITSDANSVGMTLTMSLSMLSTQIIVICGIAASMLSMSPIVTASCAAFLLPLFIAVKKITASARRLFLMRQKKLGKLSSVAEESISSMRALAASGASERFLKTYLRESERFRKISELAAVRSGALMPIIGSISNLAFAAVATVSGILMARGHIDAAAASAFLLYVRQFIRPFVDIAGTWNSFQSALAGAERVIEASDLPREDSFASADGHLRISGSLELRNVTFSYPGADRPALKDVSIKIPSGTKVAIVGETGCGKTTLIGLFNRMRDPDEGAVLIDGADAGSYALSDLRRQFAVVPQEPCLFEGSVRENIAFGRGLSQERIDAACELAGMRRMLSALPGGLDFRLTAGGTELSLGERQQIAIARAAASDAPVILLDEATASVDPLTEAEISAALVETSSGRTTVFISHRLSSASGADLIVVLDRGAVAECGTHVELIGLDGIYAKMWRARFADREDVSWKDM